MTAIAIFASGTGTNADAILSYFKDHTFVKPALIICNRKEAGIYNVAEKHGVPIEYLNKNDFSNEAKVLNTLSGYNIDFIVLAGFLLLIPAYLVSSFNNKIVNIHPALLPKYGGKGMYGKYVHEAVYKNREKISGITIHFVNERYDEGNIIFQASTRVESDDTPDLIAKKVHVLEHRHYAQIIERVISSQKEME